MLFRALFLVHQQWLMKQFTSACCVVCLFACFLACHVRYALKVKSAVTAFQSSLPGPSAVVDEAVQVSLLCCFFVFLPVM
jgi:hypothetical protein